MTQVVNKTVELQLVGLDGNAFNLLGAFSNAAKRQGWSKEEIDAVRKEATSGDYNHLLCTLIDHCEEPDDDYYDNHSGAKEWYITGKVREEDDEEDDEDNEW